MASAMMESSRSASASAHGTRALRGRSRPGGRSARVVSEVLHAAIREFSRRGYDAMRVEDIAQQAGVNKTTVYRRWPTKADLVAAALRHSSFDLTLAADTGALRSDLIELLGAIVAHTRDPLWRGVIRALNIDVHPPELARLLAMFRAEYRERWARIVQRGIDRGELPQGTSAALVSELIVALVSLRKLRNDEPMSPKIREAIVDIVLAGARTGAAVIDYDAAGDGLTAGARSKRAGRSAQARKARGAVSQASQVTHATRVSKGATKAGSKSKKTSKRAAAKRQAKRN